MPLVTSQSRPCQPVWRPNEARDVFAAEDRSSETRYDQRAATAHARRAAARASADSAEARHVKHEPVLHLRAGLGERRPPTIRRRLAPLARACRPPPPARCARPGLTPRTSVPSLDPSRHELTANLAARSWRATFARGWPLRCSGTQRLFHRSRIHRGCAGLARFTRPHARAAADGSRTSCAARRP